MSNCCKGTPIVKSSCLKDEINTDWCNPSTKIPSSCPKEASCCEEQEHCADTIIQEFFAAVKVNNTFNMPDCGETATLVTPGLTQIAVGSYLWKENIGYLEVISFSASKQLVVVRNNCQEGNADAGTEIPACSLFTVTVPPVDNQPPLSFPYVAIDFTAPANGDCLDITVTSVNTLQTGKQVQIGSGFYTLQAIVSPTVITICNDGDGITPGTSVIAKNGAGVYQYPISLIDANFCVGTPSEEGALVICDGHSQVTIEGPYNGSDSPSLILAPALEDGSKTVFRVTPIDANVRTCTKLVSSLGIVNGDPTYTLLVDDSTDFAVDDILKIEGRSEEFTVTGTGVGSIDVTAVPTPGANATVPLGSWVCVLTCCDQLNDNLAALMDAQCVPTMYVVTGNAYQIFSQPITLGGDGSYEVVLSTDLGAITLPGSASCNWMVSFDAIVSSVLDYTGLTGSMLLAEVELAMVNAGDVQNGRLVWTAYNNDGWDISGIVPGTADSIQKVLSSPNPNFPMMYNGASICSYVQAVGGTVLHPKLIFRCAVGENFAPTTVDSVKVLIGGAVKAWRF